MKWHKMPCHGNRKDSSVSFSVNYLQYGLVPVLLKLRAPTGVVIPPAFPPALKSDRRYKYTSNEIDT